MDNWINCLCESMIRYLGQTVTVFTTSGGLSGAGFTGVLISADCNCIRLLCDVGAPPACPVGSSCSGGFNNWGGGWNNWGSGWNNWGGGGWNNWGGGCGCSFNECSNPLGAICVIPTCAVAAFTHNAIG